MNLLAPLLCSVLIVHSLAPAAQASSWTGMTAMPCSTEDSAEEAMALRNGSVADYREGRHVIAAGKLEQALEMYGRLSGSFLSERATTLRAITWNHMHAKDMPNAFDAFERLCRLDAKGAEVASLEKEARSALSAITRGSYGAGGDGLAWMAKSRPLLQELGLDASLAGLMQDQGTLAAQAERSTREVLGFFRESLRLRESLGDAVGQVWTHNAMAGYALDQGDLKAVREPLIAAYGAVLGGKADVAQRAVAGQVERCLRLAVGVERPDRQLVSFLWELAALKQAGSSARVVSASWIQMTAAQTQAMQRGKRNASEAAKRLMQVAEEQDTLEARADMVLRAASLILGAKPERALSWLTTLEVGEGPCAGHLELRRATLVAMASAQLKDERVFDVSARAVLAGFEKIDDAWTRMSSLTELVEAGAKLSRPASLPELREALAKAKAAGMPGASGGAGGTVQRASEITKLALHDPVFELRVEGDEIVALDLLSGEESRVGTSWRPHNTSFNGLYTRVWGGYVCVLSVEYGNNRGSRGSGFDVREELKIGFQPMTLGKVLVVTKNGACFYKNRS